MKYIIKDILDNTTDKTRTEELYVPYLGEQCDIAPYIFTNVYGLDDDELLIGVPAYIERLTGSPKGSRVIRTSKVMDMNAEGDYTYIKTRNSTYVLERIDDAKDIL